MSRGDGSYDCLTAHVYMALIMSLFDEQRPPLRCLVELYVLGDPFYDNNNSSLSLYDLTCFQS